MSQKVSNIKKIIIKTINAVLIVFLALLTISSLYIAFSKMAGNDYPKIFGVSDAVVVTGSMDPAIPVYSLIFFKEQDSYEVQDIVCYRDDYDILITHRIIGEDEDGFIIKGDANPTPDATAVTEDRIVGKVVYVAPVFFGRFVAFVHTIYGMLTVFGLCIAIMFLPKAFAPQKKPESGSDTDIKATDKNAEQFSNGTDKSDNAYCAANTSTEDKLRELEEVKRELARLKREVDNNKKQ